MIVVDTNVLAYLIVRGARTPTAHKARSRDDDWQVPFWWRVEFLNVLALSVRHGVISREAAAEAWEMAIEMVDGRERFAMDVVLVGLIVSGLVGFGLNALAKTAEDRLLRWRVRGV